MRKRLSLLLAGMLLVFAQGYAGAEEDILPVEEILQDDSGTSYGTVEEEAADWIEETVSWPEEDDSRIEETAGWSEEDDGWIEEETGWPDDEEEWIEEETWSEEEPELSETESAQPWEWEEELVTEQMTEQMPELMADPANTLIVSVYDNITGSSTQGTFTEIYPYENLPCTRDTRSLRGRLNGSSSLGNIFTEIYWEKKITSGGSSTWVKDTTGYFSEGTWRCKLKLSLNASQMSTIVYMKEGRQHGRILFNGLPATLEWRGDGNSNGNILFESTPFTVEERIYDFEINLKGDVPDKYSVCVHDPVPVLNLEAATPEDKAAMQEKGIKIRDAYWFYYPDPENTENWVNLPHLGAGSFSEAGTYCLAVRVSCSNPKYRLDEIWTSVRVNDSSISNRSKILSDGSLLVAEMCEVYELGTKDGIRYKALDGTAKTAAATGTDSATLPADVVIPAQVVFGGVPYTVVELDQTFRYSDARTIQIPATVMTLKNDELFSGSSKLKSVIFADGCGVEELGDNCFSTCGALEQVILPGSLKKISFNAFERCKNLEGISIPASVEEIDIYAFAYCEAMTQVTIPENSRLKKIGNVAFYDCGNLTQIVLPASLETIGKRAFAKCTSLAKVSFPQGSAIKTIDTEAFGLETGSLPIQLEYVEGDTQTKAAVDSYIAWAKSQGWTHVTSKAVAPPPAPTPPAPALSGSVTASDLPSTCSVPDLPDQTVSAGDSKPALIIKSGDKTLTEGTDYDLAWSGLGKVGTASVTITGKGAYSGNITKTFRILPKGTKITSLKKGRKQAAVKWKKQTKQTDGYEIQYSTKKDFSKSVKTKRISGRKKTSAVIKKLKAKKTYYVRIRTWKKVNGERYYSLWSSAKKVKIR